MAHVDLAGDGGGDQRGAAFLEQVDGALGFSGEVVKLLQADFDEIAYLSLLFQRWEGDFPLLQVFENEIDNSRQLRHPITTYFACF